MSNAGIRFAATMMALATSVVSFGCATTTITLNDGPDTSLVRQAETKRDLGMDHLSKGRTAMAIRELMASEGLNAEDKETQLWLGEAYRRKGMLDKAAAHLERAVELDPTYHATRLTLSGLYIQMERFEDAIAQAKLLVEDPTFPTPWRALTNQSFAEYSLGRLVEARATLKRALEFHPRYWPAILNMAILENAESNRLGAIERFEEVLDLDPGSRVVAEVNYRLAEVFVALGHRERAIRHFSNSVEISPYGIWGQQSKRYLKLLR